MIRKTTTLLGGAFLVACCAPAAFAQPSARTLSELSIDELLNVRVVSTTKTSSLTLEKAPGVVRVFTREDIDRFGFVTLRDVLANVPGVQIQEYRAGHEAVWFRGIKQRYNNKVLWLVDGVPLRDSYYGHQGIDEAVPLDMVDRIEVITGPGSVLYGANAFAGVVSITTKSPKARDARSFRAAYGSLSSAQEAAEFAGGPVYGYVDHITTAGFAPALNSDGKAWRHDEDRQRTYGLFKAGTPNLEAAFSVLEHDYADTYRKAGRDRSFNRDPIYGSLHYDRDFAANARLRVLGYAEYYPLARTELRFSAPGTIARTDRDVYNTSLGGVDADLTLSRGRHTMIAGTSWQIDSSHTTQTGEIAPVESISAGLAVPRVRRRDLGMFVQDVWSLTPTIDLTGGARYDVLSAFRNEFSYRGALTASRGSYYSKLLYGTAFRVPSYREYLDVVSYNFSLRPEHLHTLEAQAGRRFKAGDVNLTFYSNTYRDLIKEIFVAKIATPAAVRQIDDEYSINANTSTIRGLELLAHAYPHDRISLTFGLSRLLTANETIGPLDPSITPSVAVSTGETGVDFLARYTASSLVDYRLTTRGDRIGLNLTALSRRRVPIDYQRSVPAENRDASNAGGFARVDLVSTVKLAEKLGLNLRADNLLGNRIFSPPFDNAAGYDAEWQGRSLRAQLTFRY